MRMSNNNCIKCSYPDRNTTSQRDIKKSKVEKYNKKKKTSKNAIYIISSRLMKRSSRRKIFKTTRNATDVQLL
jgi:hypothetical protein